jgi:predicted O-linked N-acetylglucosamine transferase (SPINDLY family)
MSADYQEHATSWLIAGLIERHDRSRFETIALSLGPDLPGSAMRQRLHAAFERFVDVSCMEDLKVAQSLRELEIDVLVDLGGLTQNSGTGVLAWRPAPIQVNYLGYSGTLGASYVDYILADRFVIPDGYAQYYSEKVVRLPDCFQVNDSARRIADATPTRAEMGLPEQGLVFCCFNNNYKITPPIFDIWMRILGSVPGSVLWLAGDQPCVVFNLQAEATKRKIDPRRLVFATRVPSLDDHLARYRLADLFLDTLPYNAHTTASDALWAGLPVLTCAGESFAARVAGSLLNAVGLPELVTHSLQAYEALVLQLARDPGALADIKKKLVANRGTCPLFDTDRFRRNIERAYTEMWRIFKDGLPPASFDL